MALSTHGNPVAFADRRREMGLTQAQLAMRASCSRASVALLESGYAPRRSEVLERILSTLGYDTSSKMSEDPARNGVSAKTAGGAAADAGPA